MSEKPKEPCDVCILIGNQFKMVVCQKLAGGDQDKLRKCLDIAEAFKQQKIDPKTFEEEIIKATGKTYEEIVSILDKLGWKEAK